MGRKQFSFSNSTAWVIWRKVQQQNKLLEVSTHSLSSLAYRALLPTSIALLCEITEIIDILHKKLKPRLKCFCKNDKYL